MNVGHETCFLSPFHRQSSVLPACDWTNEGAERLTTDRRRSESPVRNEVTLDEALSLKQLLVPEWGRCSLNLNKTVVLEHLARYHRVCSAEESDVQQTSSLLFTFCLFYFFSPHRTVIRT